MLTINCDSDGVLYDYSKEFWRMAEKHYGRKFPPSQGWGQHETMGISEKEYWDFFHFCATNGVFRHGKPIPGGIDALRAWAKEGHRVRVISHKNLVRSASTYHAQSDMIYWLHNQKILHKVEVVFPLGKFHKQGFPADVVIDDKPDLQWAQANAALNILFDQPWNADAELPDWIVRGRDWEHIRELVAEVQE